MEPTANRTHEQPWSQRWELLDRLHGGKQGDTWRARKKESVRTTGVLKTVVKERKRDAKARGRLFQEVSNLRIVRHGGGNVPKVLDDNCDSLSDASVPLYFVMEFIEGLTLGEYIEQNGLLSPSNAIKLALALCETIGIGHRANVLHRDLKPSNLTVRDLCAEDVVVLDYGLSWRDEPEQQAELTDNDEGIGNSFTDLPQRRAAGAQRRVESDISAICGILYYSLTGNRPVPIRDPHGRAPHRQPGKAVRDSCAHYEHIEALEALLDRGFEHDFIDRFPTVDELARRLKAVEAAATLERGDITEYLQKASLRLSRRSRSALLEQFRRKSHPILINTIPQYVSKRCCSDAFGIYTSPVLSKPLVSRMPEAKLPEGLDEVLEHRIALLIKPGGVDFWRLILYAVGSKGRQCVLLRRRLVPDLASPNREGAFGIAGVAVSGPFINSGAWDEVCWYQGTSLPSDEAIHAEIDDSVHWAVQGLIEEAGSEGEPTASP